MNLPIDSKDLPRQPSAFFCVHLPFQVCLACRLVNADSPCSKYVKSAAIDEKNLLADGIVHAKDLRAKVDLYVARTSIGSCFS